MHQVKVESCIRVRILRTTVVAVVAAVALNGSCLFDTNTHLCEAFGLRCGSGWVCAANQAVCIPIGGCGNGIVSAEEVCDDGNVVDGDGCSADCRSTETCGNGIVDSKAGESCDDGNRTNGDGCSDNCTLERQFCGNGILDPNEECDPGPGDSPGCDSDCRFSRCGNGHLNSAAGEQCDPGPFETANCDADCTLSVCGDGHLNSVTEVCDKGPPQTGCPGKICNSTCSACI